MTKLILVRGVSGAGKSTIAAILGQRENTHIIAADDYWGPNYDFDASKLHLAHHWCQLMTRSHLEDGFDVVVHNTSTTNKDVEVYQQIAQEHGAEFFSIIVENRHGNDSVHNVPQTVRQAQERKLRNSIKLI